MSNQPRKPNGQYDFDPNAGGGDLPSLAPSAGEPQDDFAKLGLEAEDVWREGDRLKRSFDKGDGDRLWAVEKPGGGCDVELHASHDDYRDERDTRHFGNRDDAAHYIKGELSGIPNPIERGMTTAGQTGGTAFTGGKYDSHLNPAQRVRAMRADIRALQKRGEIPSDYKVHCHTDDYGAGWQAYITVAPPRGRAYETPSIGDMKRARIGTREGRALRAIVAQHGGSATDEQIQASLDDAQRRYDAGEQLTGYQADMLVPSRETLRAMRLCRAAGEQYTAYDVDAMHDYHAQDGYIDVRMEEQRDE